MVVHGVGGCGYRIHEADSGSERRALNRATERLRVTGPVGELVEHGAQLLCGERMGHRTIMAGMQAEVGVVVGAAVVRDGRLLSCRRTEPPALAGRWEFPGGKVEAGEDEVTALVRECREELSLDVVVAARLGGDVRLPGGQALLRVYLCSVADDAQPRLHAHDELRWLAAHELFEVPWIDHDLVVVETVRQSLG